MLRFLCVFAIWLGFGAAVWAETRVALVVGNSAYQNVSALENPVNDALDISVALEGLGFQVIQGTDLVQDEMREAIGLFAERAATADVVLFYYAGHGFQVSGENYLVPVDSRLTSVDDLTRETLALGAVLEAMQASNGIKLVFLDACRDNPFGTELSESSSGLARVGTAQDFMFVYATQPDNVAYDGTGRNSFFTEAMLGHIYTPGEQVDDLLISVRRDVVSATGGRQVPWSNSSMTRPFQFDQSPATASEETLLFQVAATEQDADLMQLYMDRYPQGAHVEDVLAFLDTGATRNLATRDETAEAARLWGLARRSRMRPLLEYYLERYPDGEDRLQAERLLALIPDVEDSSPGRVCERLATHPRDATAAQSGVTFARLQQNALPAIQACAAAAAQSPDLPHYTALLARATAASGDLERAVTLYKNAADRGDLRAMVSLAQLSEAGNGMPQDAAAALALYERAAEGGSPDAMINLAVTLFEGSLVDQDVERAVSLLRRAAEFGSAKAVFNLGVLAQDGAVDSPGDALDYFIRAARDGEIAGYRAAAILLDEGRGIERDPVAAADMLLRGTASDRGALLEQLTTKTNEWSRETVRALQTRLKTAGFYTASIDGLPGPSFSNALAQWRNGGFNADILEN